MVRRYNVSSTKLVDSKFPRTYPTTTDRGLSSFKPNSYGVDGVSSVGKSIGCPENYLSRFLPKLAGRSPSQTKYGGAVVASWASRSMATIAESVPQESRPNVADVSPHIKFKRLDKTAKHIMQILDKEAVTEVRGQREIPDIKPGYIIQLKVVVPENKRRVSTLKGIVIARRNAGLNTTFRLRRLVAGVGVESLFPLYSPNIKEIKVLDKKKVRRAKLYYLRDKMNALKKQ